MKIFCCYTKSHERLLSEYFKPSLPDCLELHAIPRDGNGNGDFQSEQWTSCLHQKIDLVTESIMAHPGEIIIWSDIDILIFKPLAAELQNLLETSGKEILFQREGKHVTDINGGFYVFRASKATLAFFQQVRAGLAAHPDADDQLIMNSLLRTSTDFAWGYLPFSYYARTHGWPPPRDLTIYHANETVGKDAIGQKISQFREVLWIRKYGLLAQLISSLGKIPKRCRRLAREWFARHHS